MTKIQMFVSQRENYRYESLYYNCYNVTSILKSFSIKRLYMYYEYFAGTVTFKTLNYTGKITIKLLCYTMRSDLRPDVTF